MKSKKGFTLIELIVVLAILGVILAIAVPRYNGLQETARENADLATEELIIKSAQLMQANEGFASPASTVDAMDGAITADDDIDVSANGIDGSILYLDAGSNPQSAAHDGTAFILTGTADAFSITYE
jgi:type IV pilus assembly protein PilA